MSPLTLDLALLHSDGYVVYQGNLFINRTTYASIYDYHHKDSLIQMEMSAEAKNLYDQKMTSNEEILNGHLGQMREVREGTTFVIIGISSYSCPLPTLLSIVE